MTLHSYHARTWATERRRFWPRAVKWLLAFACWVPLVFLWWIS